MFAKAYALASEFTQPLIISTRLYGGEVKCGVGAFVVLNKDGWILTAAHLWDSFVARRRHAKEIEQYEAAVAAVQGDATLTSPQKRKKLRQLKTNRR
ncbi:unnamed protein product, partial [marine sediment metagenome]